jgi:hypothetical protein
MFKSKNISKIVSLEFRYCLKFAICSLEFLALLFVFSFWPSMASAATYDANNVVFNAVFTNKNSMSAAQIESFLVSHGSFYKNYTIPEYVSTPFPYNNGGNHTWGTVNVRQIYDPTGEQYWGKKVSQLIYNECQAHNINPQLVLVMLQKESSIVTQGNPDSVTKAWPLFFGFNETMASYGYNYDQSRQVAIDYAGVGQQIAYTVNWLSVRYNSSLSRPPSDDVPANWAAVNQASRVLYTYTPHSQYNVWSIMQSWFGGGTINYPFGKVPNTNLAKSGSNYYLIYGGTYYNLGTTSLAVQNYGHAITESLVARSGSDGGNLSNYIKASTGPEYLVAGGLKYYIYPTQAFRNRWNLNSANAKVVSSSFLNNIPSAPHSLSGLVTASSSSNVIYLIDQANRYQVYPTNAFLARFDMSWGDAVVLPQSFINSLPSKGWLTGLIRGQTKGMIYFVDEGYGKPVLSMGIFYNWGWKSSEVTFLSDSYINTFRKKSFVTRIMSGGGSLYWAENGLYYRLGDNSVMDSRGWSWSDVGSLSASFASQLPIAGVIWE